ncbi:AtpZ/AtpI family protein [Roseicyclus sp. F158]|uniref:ATP synthase protein I n=1 Tax=Tropicimonas omnivorans TaxID=3075590 RepID=A0ABU3DDN3_9RHOB|nr:AtpZ/AtpI family protein [Roseicyclus sp. F158]MDT0681797.1 AtpZ/AtpI family protein [Roseicyclus sp. F158]
MTDDDKADRLRRLDEQIARLKGTTGKPETSRVEDHHSQAQIAWRMVTELVAGLLIGLGVGMGLDALFGTKPFLLILFIGLGFFAGVRVMMRTAEEIGKNAGDRPAADDEG